MAKAEWNGVVLAEEHDPKKLEEVEGNIYFPSSALNKQYFKDSSHTSSCAWKGHCNYYSVSVNGKTNENCAWVYKNPKPAAKNIADHVAFWKGVKVTRL